MSISKFWKEAIAYRLGGGHAADHAALGIQLPPGVGNGIVDDTVAFMARAIAGSTINLMGFRYKISGQNFLPANVTINGPGEIIFTNDTDLLRFGDSNTVNNVKFTGTLSNLPQYTLFQNGVTSYFSSPTYQDYAQGANAGSDFTHTLSSNTLTVGLPSALTGQLGRLVVSSLITLNPANRYVINIQDFFVSGDAAAPIQFWPCDGAGNELSNTYGAGQSQYIPYQDSGAYLYITGLSGLKIKIGCARHNHTKLNLSATFDLSKIQVYQLSNDLASLSAASANEDATNLSCYATNTIINGCSFQNMKFASMKLVNASNCVIKNSTIKKSLGGFTTQGSTNNRIMNNDIDMTVVTSAGDYIPSGLAVRNHNIAIGSAEAYSEILFNNGKGSSWAFENAEGSALSNDIIVEYNTLSGVHVGISASATNGRVMYNKLTISSLGEYGIELPTATNVKCSFNTVYQASPAVNSYGIAGSKEMSGAVISSNTLRANNGINLSLGTTGIQGTKGIKVQNNNIEFWTSCIYTYLGGTFIDANNGVCLGRFSGLGLIPSAAISAQTVYYPTRIRNNNVDGAGAYCVYVATPQLCEIVSNNLISFTGNYVDIYVTVPAGYNIALRIEGNTITNNAVFPISTDTTTPFTGSWLYFARNFKSSRIPILAPGNYPTTTLVLDQSFGQSVIFTEGSATPAQIVSNSQLYVDSSKNLKIMYGDGTTKTITVV